ncbi:MAG: hypothetical protein EAX96_19670 [Candidatus Lokiarchaeota archaeon]|nr:hypothetical protein [Candidatus Lokiarchaeota archaeon]
MVEEFKLREKIKKKLQLKKPTFDNKNDFLNVIYATRNAWNADQWEDFIVLNQNAMTAIEKAMEKNTKLKGTYKNILKDLQKRQSFAEIALIYYTALEAVITATLKKDKELYSKALQLMDEAIEECQNHQFGPKYAVEIKKKKEQAEKDIQKIF